MGANFNRNIFGFISFYFNFGILSKGSKKPIQKITIESIVLKQTTDVIRKKCAEIP